MDSILYKGYVIEPEPYQLSENFEWTTTVSIAKHRCNSVTERQYNASNTFKTEEEAKQNAIYFAQQIIDGQYPNLSVDDL